MFFRLRRRRGRRATLRCRSLQVSADAMAEGKLLSDEFLDQIKTENEEECEAIPRNNLYISYFAKTQFETSKLNVLIGKLFVRNVSL